MLEEHKMAKQKESAAVKAIGRKKDNSVRTIRILAFLIPVIAVLLGMLAGSFAPFGGKDVMSAGGMSKHLTYYYELHDRVHNGDSLIYSLTTGSGYDFTTVFTYYLSDPINLIILLFPRTAILSVLNILYMLKIGLAGLFFSIFLTHRKERIERQRISMEEKRADAIQSIKDRIARKKEAALAKAAAAGKAGKKDFVLGGSGEPKTAIGALLARLDITNLGFSVAFALSAYMFGQGLDVSHLSVVVLFPLILMALDNLLEKGKWRLYAALMAASIFCNLHMTIIVFIFTVIYAVLFEHDNLRTALWHMLLKLMSDILAIGAGAIIVVNCFGSSFLHDELSMKFPLGGSLTSFFDAFKALFPTTKSSITDFYGYGIDIFCGILVVLLIVLYAANPNISLRKRISQCGLLAALYMGLFLLTPNYLFNGFFYSEANVCLFGFLFVAQALSMAYEELMNIDHTPVIQIVGALVILASVVLLTPTLCDGYLSIQPAIYAVEFLAIYAAIILLYRSRSMTKGILMIAIPLVLIVEICITYVDGLREVGSEAKAYAETIESQVYEASRALQHANPGSRVYYFDSDTSQSTPVTNMMQGYDFVITKKRGGSQYIDSTLELMTETQSISLYRNPYSLHGFYLPKSIESWNYDAKYPFYSQDNLIRGIIGAEAVFTAAPGDTQTMESPIFAPNGTEDPRRMSYMFVFTPTKDGDIYASLFNVNHLGECKAGESANFFHDITKRDIATADFASEYAIFDKDNYIKLYDTLSETVLYNNSETACAFSCDASEEGYIVIPFPYQSGWSVTGADSSEIKTFMNDLMMIPVSAGENSISLEYHPVYFYIGIAISIAFLAVLILLAVRNSIKLSTGCNNVISGISKWARDNYVYILTFALLTLIFLITQMYTSSYPFGDRSTVAGDGYDQAYNGFVDFSESLKRGNYSFLNWNVGFGINRLSSFLGYLLTPWAFLENLILPSSLYMLVFTLQYAVQFLLPGLSLILYLTHRRRGTRMDKHDWRLIVLGTVYGLSSYAISFFMYGNFGFLYYVPLIILGMERLIYDKKPALYIIMLFFQMVDAYYAFILCEFLFLYFFLMEFDSVRDFFMKGIRFALASIAAAGLSCFRLIPYYFSTLESPYQAADTISPITKASGSYLSVFADATAYRDPIMVTTNDFSVNLYMGILVLACIPLFLLNKKVKMSVRIRRVILMAVYFLAFGSSLLNYIFHGFHYQVQVPNRFAAFFLFLLIISFCDCLQSWEETRGRTFALTLGVPLIAFAALSVVAYSQDYMSQLSLVMTLVFIGVYLLLCLAQLLKKYRKQLRTAILVICMLEVILSSFHTFPQAIGGRTPASVADGINELCARNPDMTDPFTSTEYISEKSYNMALATGMTSNSAFSSYMSKQHQELFWKWNLLTTNNSLLYVSGNPLADMMLHLKYNISNDHSDASWSRYPIKDHYGSLNLHENPYFLPLGIFFPSSEKLDQWNVLSPNDFSDEKTHAANAFKYQNAFSRILCGYDLYEEIIPETDASKLTEEDKENYSYIQADSTELENGTSDTVPVWVSVAKDVEGDVFISYNNSIFYIGTTYAGQADTFSVSMFTATTDYYIRIATSNDYTIEKLYETMKQNVMTNIEQGFSSVSGTINASEDGMVYISLPNMNGWTCYVDGSEVTPKETTGGIWLPVTKGEHEIKLSYTPRGLWLGIAGSCGSLVILIAVWIILRRRKKRPTSASEETIEDQA